MTFNAIAERAAPNELGAFADPLTIKTMELSFRDKQICFVVPAGSRIDAFSLDLPGGILVLGALRGKVTCACGAMVIAKGGEFQGFAEAEDIYIEGMVTSPSVIKPGIEQSKLKARGLRVPQPDGTTSLIGGLLALSETANVKAHLQARVFHVSRNSELTKSILETI